MASRDNKLYPSLDEYFYLTIMIDQSIFSSEIFSSSSVERLLGGSLDDIQIENFQKYWSQRSYSSDHGWRKKCFDIHVTIVRTKVKSILVQLQLHWWYYDSNISPVSIVPDVPRSLSELFLLSMRSLFKYFTMTLLINIYSYVYIYLYLIKMIQRDSFFKREKISFVE